MNLLGIFWQFVAGNRNLLEPKAKGGRCRWKCQHLSFKQRHLWKIETIKIQSAFLNNFQGVHMEEGSLLSLTQEYMLQLSETKNNASHLGSRTIHFERSLRQMIRLLKGTKTDSI